jgi:hypothetical protein
VVSGNEKSQEATRRLEKIAGKKEKESGGSDERVKRNTRKSG